MITLAQKHDTEALKKFARTMIWAFPLVFSLLLPWLFSYDLPWWPLLVSLLLSLFYLLKPSLIYYPYRLWMGLALTLGWVNTRIILSAVFYLMILPMGLLLRLFKKLQYRKHPCTECDSFYHTRDEKMNGKDLENPF